MNVGLVFGIIFTVIVMGLLLVFGTGIISDMLGLGSQAQVQKSIKDIENQVKNLVTLSRGSTLPYKVAIPQNTKICFVNSTDPSHRYYAKNSRNWDPEKWEQDSILSNGYNIWYYLGTPAGYSYSISKLYVYQGNSFCVTTNDNLFFSNKGGVVEVQIT